MTPRAATGTPATAAPGRPLEGLRVLDVTSWWAGPSGTQMLAALGADVIHVESIAHPDGMRLTGRMFGKTENWWEWGHMFVAANHNKRAVTLDLSSPVGRDLLLRLVDTADVFVENFSPRVIEGFDLDWDTLSSRNPNLVMVRMPAFGLDGPWRERVGFAQTMEQMSGMAWLTGHPNDQPRIPRGPCDPIAGMHGAFNTILALRKAELTGQGVFVESAMIESAVNCAAEMVIEWTANGVALERLGNRSRNVAPQGVYAGSGDETWLAVSVETDEQWRALAGLIGSDPSSTVGDRQANHDDIDAAIAAFVGARTVAEAETKLREAGVPAVVCRTTPLCTTTHNSRPADSLSSSTTRWLASTTCPVSRFAWTASTAGFARLRRPSANTTTTYSPPSALVPPTLRISKPRRNRHEARLNARRISRPTSRYTDRLAQPRIGWRMIDNQPSAPACYKAVRDELIEALRPLNDQQASVVVPACPEWTVKDVVAHLCGLNAELLANVDSLGSDEATTRQVGDRASNNLNQVLEEWLSLADAINERFTTDGNMAAALLADLVVHVYDLKEVLNQSTNDAAAAIALSADRYVQRLQKRVADELQTALTVELIDGSTWPAPEVADSATVTVRAMSYDFVRGVTGRLRRDEVEAFEWSSDPAAILDRAWNLYGPFRI